MNEDKTHFYAEFKSGNCVTILSSDADYAKGAARDFAQSYQTRVTRFHKATDDEVQDFKRQGGTVYETV
jgi:hypothetical protein